MRVIKRALTDYFQHSLERDENGWSVFAIQIPLARLPLLEKRLEKIQKNSAKLDLPMPSWEIVDRALAVEDGYIFEQLTIEFKVLLDYTFNGWSYVATLHHTPEGNIVQHNPCWDGSPMPLELRYSDGTHCDHCPTVIGQDRSWIRHRKLTYAVYSDDTNEFKQVGSACLADYLGAGPGARITALARYYKYLYELAEDKILSSPVQEEEYHGYETIRFISYACQSIRQRGFHKSKFANSTVDDTVKRLLEDYRSAYNNEPRPFQPSEEDRKWANDAISWAANLAEDCEDDYLRNLRIIAHNPYLSRSDRYIVAVAASLPVTYQRMLEKQKEDENPYTAGVQAISRYVGKKGARIKVSVEVTEKKHITPRGRDPYWLVKFKTFDGNILYWFTGTDQSSVEEKSRWWISARVKDQKLFNGQQQTQLTRVSFDKPYQSEVGEFVRAKATPIILDENGKLVLDSESPFEKAMKAVQPSGRELEID